MQNDDVVWSVIGSHFCSFKQKTDVDTFCRNPHNVTNICSRTTCPLANSLYATVMEFEGECYLYLKTAERAHTPKYLWEKIPLSKNYTEALRQIERHMTNVYKESQIFRCKQRLTRIRQTLLRMKRLRLQPKVHLVSVKKKTERREANREVKAEKAAKLETAIESELLTRLHQGVYGNLYMKTKAHEETDQVVKVEENEEVKQREREADGDVIFEEESDVEYEDVTEYEDESCEDHEADLDDEEMALAAVELQDQRLKRSLQQKRPRVEIEYEDESGAKMSQQLLE